MGVAHGQRHLHDHDRGMMLGRICASRMRASLLPESRAASTNPASRRTLASARATARIEREIDDRGSDDDVPRPYAERRHDAHGRTNSGKAMMVSAI